MKHRTRLDRNFRGNLWVWAIVAGVLAAGAVDQRAGSSEGTEPYPATAPAVLPNSTASQAEIDRNVALLLTGRIEDFEIATRALDKIGKAAVPKLNAALVVANPDGIASIMAVLDGIGDTRSIPALTAIIDRHPAAEYSKEQVSARGEGICSVLARETVVHILNPDSRNWPGAGEASPPDDVEAFAKRVAYERRITRWYSSWLQAATKPATAPENLGNGSMPTRPPSTASTIPARQK
jgi:hypothetical protein